MSNNSNKVGVYYLVQHLGNRVMGKTPPQTMTAKKAAFLNKQLHYMEWRLSSDKPVNTAYKAESPNEG